MPNERLGLEAFCLGQGSEGSRILTLPLSAHGVGLCVGIILCGVGSLTLGQGDGRDAQKTHESAALGVPSCHAWAFGGSQAAFFGTTDN